MGNFSNVTMGVGTAIEVDAQDIGFTKGNVQITRGVETKDFDSGIPLQTRGRVIFKEQVEIIVPMAEITAVNLSHAALNVPVTIIAGTPVTVTDGANQERTFAAIGGNGDIEKIFLDGPNITAASLTVKNVAETVTYVEDTDYFVDYTRGEVYRAPNGAIASGGTVRVNYAYTPPASERLNFGKNIAVTNRSFRFTHISPVSGRIMEVWVPKASAQGQLELNYQEEEFMIVNLNLKGIPDEVNYPDSPLGYLDIQPAP